MRGATSDSTTQNLQEVEGGEARAADEEWTHGVIVEAARTTMASAPGPSHQLCLEIYRNPIILAHQKCCIQNLKKGLLYPPRPNRLYVPA